jgi:hypothetical protein
MGLPFHFDKTTIKSVKSYFNESSGNGMAYLHRPLLFSLFNE